MFWCTMSIKNKRLLVKIGYKYAAISFSLKTRNVWKCLNNYCIALRHRLRQYIWWYFVLAGGDCMRVSQGVDVMPKHS